MTYSLLVALFAMLVFPGAVLSMDDTEKSIAPVLKYTLIHNTQLLKLELENNPTCVNTREPDFASSKATDRLYHDETIGKIRHALYTPIFYAIRDGNDTSFDLLLNQKEIDLTVTDCHGNTVLDSAVTAAFRNKDISYAEKILAKPGTDILIYKKNHENICPMDHVNSLIKQIREQEYDHQTLLTLESLKNLFEFYYLPTNK